MASLNANPNPDDPRWADETWVTQEDKELREELQALAVVIAGTELSHAYEEGLTMPRTNESTLSGLDSALVLAAGAPEWFMEKVQQFIASHERCPCEIPLREHALDMFDALVRAKSKDPETLEHEIRKMEAAVGGREIMAHLMAREEGE